MLIGIDGNEANVERRVGVNEYAYQVLWNIYKLSDEWKARHKFVIYLQNKPKHLPPETGCWRYRIIEGRGLWILTRLTPHLWLTREKPDVFFTPSHYVPPLLMIPRVCSIMDLGYLKFSGQFRRRDYWQLRLWSAWSITVAKYIIAISNTTAKDIVRHYRNARDKVKTTLLAYDKGRYHDRVLLSDVRRVSQKYTIGSDYVLFLSTLKPSKNIEGLLEAWKMIGEEFENVKLVIAGKKGWLFESIFEKVTHLGLEKRVVFTGFVDEEDKPGLIKGARVFVLPSFWEGFGLDVISAMACGVPVVVSDRGSLPEIVGKVGIVVNPDNPEDIAEGIRKVLKMSKMEYDKVKIRGISHAKKFSWEKTAWETLKILESV